MPLQDHPAVLSAFYLKEEAGPISVPDELLHSDGRIRLRAIMKYLLFKKGPLTTTGCDHGAFVSTKGEPSGPCKTCAHSVEQMSVRMASSRDLGRIEGSSCMCGLIQEVWDS